jgi:hypothetical protein
MPTGASGWVLPAHHARAHNLVRSPTG